MTKPFHHDDYGDAEYNVKRLFLAELLRVLTIKLIKITILRFMCSEFTISIWKTHRLNKLLDIKEGAEHKDPVQSMLFLDGDSFTPKIQTLNSYVNGEVS